MCSHWLNSEKKKRKSTHCRRNCCINRGSSFCPWSVCVSVWVAELLTHPPGIVGWCSHSALMFQHKPHLHRKIKMKYYLMNVSQLEMKNLLPVSHCIWTFSWCLKTCYSTLSSFELRKLPRWEANHPVAAGAWCCHHFLTETETFWSNTCFSYTVFSTL